MGFYALFLKTCWHATQVCEEASRVAFYRAFSVYRRKSLCSMIRLVFLVSSSSSTLHFFAKRYASTKFPPLLFHNLDKHIDGLLLFIQMFILCSSSLQFVLYVTEWVTKHTLNLSNEHEWYFTSSVTLWVQINHVSWTYCGTQAASSEYQLSQNQYIQLYYRRHQLKTQYHSHP